MSTNKCTKCGVEVPDKEWRERYEELLAMGIVPMMILICKKCREAK